MRTTQASAAVERLRKRSGNPGYSMARHADGSLSLRLAVPDAPAVVLGAPLPMAEFVRFVDAIAPEPPKRVSKLDEAFSAQLRQKRNTGNRS